MKIEKLAQYMRARAAFEQVKWGLTKSFLQSHFDAGIRSFFGVELSDRGELLRDLQQPEFFRTYQAS